MAQETAELFHLQAGTELDLLCSGTQGADNPQVCVGLFRLCGSNLTPGCCWCHQYEVTFCTSLSVLLCMTRQGWQDLCSVHLLRFLCDGNICPIIYFASLLKLGSC